MSYNCQKVCEGIDIIVFQWFLEHCLGRGGDNSGILDLIFSKSLLSVQYPYSVGLTMQYSYFNYRFLLIRNKGTTAFEKKKNMQKTERKWRSTLLYQNTFEESFLIQCI